MRSRDPGVKVQIMRKRWLTPPVSGSSDRVIAAWGAPPGPVPAIFGQALQRLGGHLNELRHQVAEYGSAAALTDLGEYISENRSPDQIFVSTGRIIVELTERLTEWKQPSRP